MRQGDIAWFDHHGFEQVRQARSEDRAVTPRVVERVQRLEHRIADGTGDRPA
ncbi:hypothetical protein J1792_00685 [Streptomyces triculaminicus]|uniref:Uncharacterized protein n=2 Tax=Streptomyces TaxID=1883 RepID=A0A939FHW7_9ACTN|nr:MULTISPECIES: hypothetical protein [Streptomyces]MBO0651369.1 hypothetical protein [Streptomyces triculaminicus]QSY49682.1 hypothetical protein J3S04_00680 [Streptomyces griseocarneus]